MTGIQQTIEQRTGRGTLAIVLHAHLPYVRHPEHPDFFEESWLFEAITESYLPLLRVFRSWEDLGMRNVLTISISPPLAAMLGDPLLIQRYSVQLAKLHGLAEREVARCAPRSEEHRVAAFYLNRVDSLITFYEHELQSRVLDEIKRLAVVGVIELATTAATHGFLPLLISNPAAVRAQVLIARDTHRAVFGMDPAGMWLPECAYVSGIETFLAEANIRWFVLDSHGLLFGNPQPRFAIYRHCFTPAGPAVFARDRESSRQVWSAEEGYPGDPAYREFYRDVGFDLSDEHVEPFLAPDGKRRFTGLKYRRITGSTSEKAFYDRDLAVQAADGHATHFLDERRRQLRELSESLPVDPIVVVPFDAELFGHWWFEGPEFLDFFARKAWFDQQDFEMGTLNGFLRKHPGGQLIVPSSSSWGHRGYWEVWLGESNSWIYPHLHGAAKRMSEVATRMSAGAPTAQEERCLRQMARELLLAQASDWAFLMRARTAGDYPEKRTRNHLLRFNRLYDGLVSGSVDEALLADCEWRSPLYENVNWRYYAG
jgi:1,4-alpha-glucan branching enzyme